MRNISFVFVLLSLAACGGSGSTFGSDQLAPAADGPPCQCNDGVDNDRDGLVDYPADPGCASATSNSEFSPTEFPSLDVIADPYFGLSWFIGGGPVRQVLAQYLIAAPADEGLIITSLDLYVTSEFSHLGLDLEIDGVWPFSATSWTVNPEQGTFFQAELRDAPLLVEPGQTVVVTLYVWSLHLVEPGVQTSPVRLLDVGAVGTWSGLPYFMSAPIAGQDGYVTVSAPNTDYIIPTGPKG